MRPPHQRCRAGSSDDPVLLEGRVEAEACLPSPLSPEVVAQRGRRWREPATRVRATCERAGERIVMHLEEIDGRNALLGNEVARPDSHDDLVRGIAGLGHPGTGQPDDEDLVRQTTLFLVVPGT
jgi:hypothetical protein